MNHRKLKILGINMSLRLFTSLYSVLAVVVGVIIREWSHNDYGSRDVY